MLHLYYTKVLWKPYHQSQYKLLSSNILTSKWGRIFIWNVEVSTVLSDPPPLARCSDLLRNLHNSTKAMKFLLFVNGLWRCGKMDPIWSGGENFKRSISFTEFGVKIMSHVLFMQFEYPNWSGQIGSRRFDVLQIYNVQLVAKKTETVYGGDRCHQNVNLNWTCSILEWYKYAMIATQLMKKVFSNSWTMSLDTV